MIPKITSLIKDQNGISVQIGNSFLTVDGDSNGSPFSATGGVDTLVVPEGAVEFIVYPITNDLAVSEDSMLSTYDSVQKGSKESFPCAMMENIYIQGSASDVVYFRFTIV